MKCLLSSLALYLVMGIAVFGAGDTPELEYTENGFIPAEVLFKTVNHAGVTISPSGKYLAGTRMYKRRKYSWGANTFTYDLDNRKIRTIDDDVRHRIRWFGFSSDDALLVESDAFNLFRLNPAEKSPEMLVAGPWGGSNYNQHLSYCQILDLLPADPDHILLYTGIMGDTVWGKSQKFITKDLDIDTKMDGVWKLNIRTGENEQIIYDDRNTTSWWLDASNNLGLAKSWPNMEVERDGSFSDELWREIKGSRLFLIRDNKFKEQLPIDLGIQRDDMLIQFEDPVFSKAGDKLYYLSQIETDTVSLMSLDLETKQTKVLKSDPSADIASIIKDPYTKTLIGYTSFKGKGQQHYFDPGLDSIRQSLQAAFPDDQPNLVEWDRNYERFLVQVQSDVSLGKYYFFDRTNGRIELVFDPAPWLNGYALSRMQVIHYQARDGLSIEGFLTLPANRKAEAPYPLILLVHGGPWQRDHWGFNGWVQFLANRGYAVLQVNFRGSLGYGREFVDKANLQWGKSMQDDLTDAVKWAIKEGHADPDRVAIMGASYGGYATMVGLTLTPDLYKVGIAMAGLYDLTSRIDDIRHYSQMDESYTYDVIRTRIGDPETHFDELKSVSPMFHVDKVKVPVLVTHGHEDRVVRIDQSFDLVRRLRKAKKDYARHWAPDTGHSFGSEEKRIDLANTIESFLREHMPSDLMR